MPTSHAIAPESDPTPIFELYRGSYGSELLTAAVSHFHLFDLLSGPALPWDKLQAALKLQSRPMHVLITARAMRLLDQTATGQLALTALARTHLTASSRFDVSKYIGLSASSPGVIEMIERLETNRPAGAEEKETGAAFIFRDGIESAMESEATARQFTLALSGRAKNVAPVLAQRLPLEGARKLLDIGGGTGIYSIALVQKNPALRAIVFDRPEVLKVAAEIVRDCGVEERVELRPGDMFRDPLPSDCDVVLLSNILHDWDVPECQQLVHRCAAATRPGGQVCVHDVFLNDALDGPLPIALYSAALYCFTEGRAYSAAEYRTWLSAAGLTPGEVVPTLVHCGVLTARK